MVAFITSTETYEVEPICEFCRSRVDCHEHAARRRDRRDAPRSVTSLMPAVGARAREQRGHYGADKVWLHKPLETDPGSPLGK